MGLPKDMQHLLGVSDDELPVSETDTNRCILAWERMVEAVQDLMQMPKAKDAKSFKGMLWYLLGEQVHYVLARLAIALLATVRATEPKSKDRRANLEQLAGLFRWLMDSAACTQLRNKFPSSHEPRLIACLNHVQYGFGGMLALADRATLEDVAFQQLVGGGVLGSLENLVQLIDDEAEGQDRSNWMTGFWFPENDDASFWDMKPIKELYGKERTILIVLADQPGVCVSYRALLEACGETFCDGTDVDRAGDLATLVGRIKTALLAVGCPYDVVNKKRVGYVLRLVSRLSIKPPSQASHDTEAGGPA